MLRHDLAPRIFFDEPIELTLTDSSVVHGQALNLSGGGIFVRTATLLAADTPVKLKFRLPNRMEITALGTVIRPVTVDQVEPQGMALRFDHLDEESSDHLTNFIAERLRPARGETVKLQIQELPITVTAKTQATWNNVVSVDAELPFLRLGSDVQLQPNDTACPDTGQIRWVSVNVHPKSGVPRLNIGIELEGAPPPVEEDSDPVCTDDYISYSADTDQSLREARRR